MFNNFKILLLFVFMLFFSINTFSQTDTLSRVTLLSGESYTGQIVMQNSEMLMLQLTDGTRYQFPVADISDIKQIVSSKTTITNNNDVEEKPEPGSICGMLEIMSGGAKASGKFDFGIPAQVSIAFGVKQTIGLPIFTGVGAGYFLVNNTDNKEFMGFVPVFLRFKYNKTEKPVVPYFMLDAGYSISLAKSYNGGIYLKTSAGIQFNISEHTAIYAGLFCGSHGFSGTLTEVRENQKYNYTGNSAIINFGLNCGLQF